MCWPLQNNAEHDDKGSMPMQMCMMNEKIIGHGLLGQSGDGMSRMQMLAGNGEMLVWGCCMIISRFENSTEDMTGGRMAVDSKEFRKGSPRKGRDFISSLLLRKRMEKMSLVCVEKVI